MKSRTPFPLNLIRGQIGKKIVVKHYAYGVVTTRYPDMSRIVPSAKQLENRCRFKAACAYAQRVLSDPAQRQHWETRARKQKITARNLLIRLYLREHPVAVASVVEPVASRVRCAGKTAEKRVKRRIVDRPVWVPEGERGMLRAHDRGSEDRWAWRGDGAAVLLFSG